MNSEKCKSYLQKVWSTCRKSFSIILWHSTYSLYYYHITQISVSILHTIGINKSCILHVHTVIAYSDPWALVYVRFMGQVPLPLFPMTSSPEAVWFWYLQDNLNTTTTLNKGLLCKQSSRYLNWEKCKQWILVYNLYYNYVFYFYKILN